MNFNESGEKNSPQDSEQTKDPTCTVSILNLFLFNWLLSTVIETAISCSYCGILIFLTAKKEERLLFKAIN